MSAGSRAEPRRTVIEPAKGLRGLDFAELVRYRDLFFFFVWRDLKVRYKQTALGLGWALLPPVVNVALFSLVFGRMAGLPSDGVPYPVFSYVAVVPWTYFASSVNAATNSLVANKMLERVYFPRVLVPITPVLVALVDFLVAALLVVPLMLYFDVAPTAGVVWLPLLVAIMILTSAGLGLWLSSLAVQYRDVKFAAGFLLQALMYAAPVVWPTSLIDSAPARLAYGFYPMAGVIEGFRAALLGTVAMPWDLVLPGAASAVVLFVSGVYYFRFKERVFADVL